MMEQEACQQSRSSARSTIIRNSACLGDVLQALRKHYGFQTSGSYLMKWPEFRLQSGESYEDLYQHMLVFLDNLLRKGDTRTHNDEVALDDEEISQSFDSVYFDTG